MDAPHRRRLRHRPELAGVAAEIRIRHVDGQVRQGPPEVVQRDTGIIGVALIADEHRPIDDDIARRSAEAGHIRVIADLEVKRIGRRSVRAGLEQQCVALRPELVGDLLRGDRVNCRLDLALRHRRVEHQHVRTEIGCPGLRRARGCRRRRTRAGRRRRQHRADGEHRHDRNRAQSARRMPPRETSPARHGATILPGGSPNKTCERPGTGPRARGISYLRSGALASAMTLSPAP